MADKIGIIGAGAWGTALAMLLADKGHDVTLWMFEKDLADETARTRENRVYLPGFTLPASIKVTASLETAVKDMPAVLSVVPSHTVRSVAKQFAPFLSRDAVIISASKGIEIESLMPLSDVFKDILPPHHHHSLCFLSGPSFAKEVAQKMPTAVALASYDPAIGRKAQELLSNAYFRVYTNTDVIGVEIAGSLKNVVAIGRAPHARARGNGKARHGHGREHADIPGPGRYGRSRAYLYGRPVPEPYAGNAPRQGREAR